MPVVTSASNWEVGIAKQSAEGSIPTVADYAFPVFDGTPQPVRTTDTISVTDATSIQGDPQNKPDEHWEADVTVPAFADSLGRLLVTMWPTDTPTGTTPKT